MFYFYCSILKQDSFQEKQVQYADWIIYFSLILGILIFLYLVIIIFVETHVKETKIQDLKPKIIPILGLFITLNSIAVFLINYKEFREISFPETVKNLNSKINDSFENLKEANRKFLTKINTQKNETYKKTQDLEESISSQLEELKNIQKSLEKYLIIPGSTLGDAFNASQDAIARAEVNISKSNELIANNEFKNTLIESLFQIINIYKNSTTDLESVLNRLQVPFQLIKYYYNLFLFNEIQSNLDTSVLKKRITNILSASLDNILLIYGQKDELRISYNSTSLKDMKTDFVDDSGSLLLSSSVRIGTNNLVICNLNVTQTVLAEIFQQADNRNGIIYQNNRMIIFRYGVSNATSLAQATDNFDSDILFFITLNGITILKFNTFVPVMLTYLDFLPTNGSTAMMSLIRVRTYEVLEVFTKQNLRSNTVFDILMKNLYLKNYQIINTGGNFVNTARHFSFDGVNLNIKSFNNYFTVELPNVFYIKINLNSINGFSYMLIGSMINNKITRLFQFSDTVISREIRSNITQSNDMSPDNISPQEAWIQTNTVT